MTVAERTVRLADGRDLAVALFGDPVGRPVLYCHGFPGSRLEAALGTEAARHRGVCLAGIDRPGIGRSSPAPGRQLRDWPADLAAVADALGYRRFSVLGVSGGGPYAAACARALADRVSGVGIVCGLGPPESLVDATGIGWRVRAGLATARSFPDLVSVLFGLLAGVAARHADRGLGVIERLLPAIDRAVLARPEVRAAILRSFREGLRQGGQGPARDIVLLARPWGFALDDVRVPVHLWHGELDATVPAGMGRHLARRIPGCQARFLPGEGHYSLPVGHMDEILAALA